MSTQKRVCPRKSVGAIIERDGKILLIDRVNIPHGWAGVAGHIEEGRAPEEMLKQEIREEVGLQMIETSLQLLFEEMVPWNNCKRSGEGGHYWYVYHLDAIGELRPEEREVRGFGWFTREEIQHLHLEPVWRYFLEKLGYI